MNIILKFQESNAWVEQIIAKIRLIMSTFNYQHKTKASANVFNTPTYFNVTGATKPEDNTIDSENNNLPSGNQFYRKNLPTQALCDSIANKNIYMKQQLSFLLERLNERQA